MAMATIKGGWLPLDEGKLQIMIMRPYSESHRKVTADSVEEQGHFSWLLISTS